MTKTAHGVSRLATVLIDPVEVWLGVSVAYLLSLLGAAVVRRDRKPAAGMAPGAEPSRVITLVPAHDEEFCVASAVAALARQRYPEARRETIVIADNCGDLTAAHARAAGATVWERTDAVLTGKGPALHWALERLRQERPDAEVVALVDADCVASENFIESVATALRCGAEAVQVKYVVSNAGAAPEAALRAAGFCLMNEIRPRGKSALGLSCGLLGTGMAFQAELLREIPWDSYSVTEDVQFHLRLLEAGHRVSFIGHASVASPMPTSAQAARSQQLRWEGGNAAMARVAPRLLRMAVRRRDPQLAHGAFERFVPSQSVLAAGTLGLVARRGQRGRIARLIASGQAAFVVGGLVAAGAPPSVWRALPQAPALVIRKLRLIAQSLTGGAGNQWVRTDREEVTLA